MEARHEKADVAQTAASGAPSPSIRIIMQQSSTPCLDDDLLRLDDLSEESLIAALHARFEARKRIYTSAGSILIAINPYAWSEE